MGEIFWEFFHDVIYELLSVQKASRSQLKISQIESERAAHQLRRNFRNYVLLHEVFLDPHFRKVLKDLNDTFPFDEMH